MKKFLLLAAFFAAFTMSAQEFTLTEVKSTTNVPTDRMNNRQGFGMDGAFVVQDKVLGQINSYDAEDGSLIGTLETGATAAWPAVTRDEAGNIIARVDNSWPGSFMADTVIMKIFPAGMTTPIDVVGNIFADFASENGRCDFFGFVEGNVLEEGIMWLVTSNSTGVMKVPFVDGEIDADHIALFPIEGAALNPTSSTVVNPYTTVNGERHYMLWTRNAQPVDMVMNEDEDGFIGVNFTLPDKGATNGCFPFAFAGKDLVLYTTLPNYGNAWAIAEKGAEEPIAFVPEEAGYVTNGFQCNWLNAEVVSDTKAVIYQYFPGNYFKTYELTIGGGPVEHTYAVCGTPAALYGMENDWDPIAAPEMTLNEETGLYEWTSAETALEASKGNVEFKVIQDHSWDVCFPENNYVIPIEAAGSYTLNVTYNPETNEVNATLTPVEVPHTYAVCGTPAALYGMENDWDPTAAPEMTLNEETGLYEWTSAETELAAGNVEFKVVQDHAWNVCYPENNYVIPVEAAGNYTLSVTYNPETNEVNATLEGEPFPPEPTNKVYIIGEVNGNTWATNVGVEMDTEDGKVFTSDVTLQRPEEGVPGLREDDQPAKYCYFSFATKLMEAADDWAGLAPYRFGAVSEATEDNPNGDFHFYRWMLGQPLQLTYNGDPRAFMVPEGTYTFTVDMEAMTLTIVGEITGIEVLNTDVKADNNWYNLQGQKLNGMPSVPGIYINAGKKVIIK
ncbi:MAG: hypothetical protein IKX63_01170 [Muribaculaceae bacterium]|nr:hypothetical protein [Muribaculaceae bacterium]